MNPIVVVSGLIIAGVGFLLPDKKITPPGLTKPPEDGKTDKDGKPTNGEKT